MIPTRYYWLVLEELVIVVVALYLMGAFSPHP